MKNGVIKVKFSKELKKELIKELRKVFDDKEFVIGILCDLRSDEDIETLLTYIQKNENIESQDIILFAMNIDKLDNDLIVDDFNIVSKGVEEIK